VQALVFVLNLVVLHFLKHSDGRVITSMQDVENSNSGAVKSDTVLKTACHRFNIYASTDVVLALCRRDGLAPNLLHILA